MNKRLLFWQVPLWLSLALVAAGCAKRDDESMNVDDIQGKVDAIERNLRRMSEAIRKGQPDEALPFYDAARESLERDRAQLRAYPEFGELAERMNAAPAELCLGFVNRAVVDFFATVRKKDLEESRKKFDQMHKEYAGCERQLETRPEFDELKQNIDSAPQSLVELEKVLEEERKVQRLNKDLADYAERLTSLNKNLANLESQSDPARLAEKTLERSSKLQSDLAAVSEWKDRPEWDAFSSKTLEELKTIEHKRQILLRQVKVIAVIDSALPGASRDAGGVRSAKSPKEQEALLASAAEGFGRCESGLSALVLEEPRLAGYVRPWEGSDRSVAWLITHCGKRAEELKLLLKQHKKANKAAKPPARDRKNAKAKKKPARSAPKPAQVK